MSKTTPTVPSIKGKGLGGFYRDVVREMKHVTWPTRHEAFRLTGVVLGVCGLLTLLLYSFSFAVEQLLHILGIGGK